jgi:hypothetical protein
VYVGFGTPEIKEMPLHYSFQSWRDCTETGQPERYLGREFFTGKAQEIEHRILTWIEDIINLHIETGAHIHAFLKKACT